MQTSPVHQMLIRQRALLTLAAGCCAILMLLCLQTLWPGIPRPFFLRYLPIVPAFLFALGIWLYPAAGLSLRRRRLRFASRLSALSALLLAPFSVWLSLFPEKHYFQVCAAMGWIALAYAVVAAAVLLAEAAPSGSFRRLAANYIRYSGLLFLLVPASAFFLWAASGVGQFSDPLALLHPALKIFLLHPIILFIPVLILWPTQEDSDLPAQPLSLPPGGSDA